MPKVKAYFFEVASVENKGEPFNGVPVFTVTFMANNAAGQPVEIVLEITKTSKVLVSFPDPLPTAYELSGQSADWSMVRPGFIMAAVEPDGWFESKIMQATRKKMLVTTGEIVLLVR